MIKKYMYNRISQTKSEIHVPLDLGYSPITIKLSHLTQRDDQNKENNHNKQKDVDCLDCPVTRGNQYTDTHWSSSSVHQVNKTVSEPF